VVLGKRLLGTCAYSKGKPSNQLENTRIGVRGEILDIAHILMLFWFEPVLYLDTIFKFLETTDKPEYFVGFTDNIGDPLIFKISKNDFSTVLHRSVVQSATDSNHQNKQAAFNPDL
jgi:hypothetical protein